jgi:hypothetical protein
MGSRKDAKPRKDRQALDPTPIDYLIRQPLSM